MVDASACVTAVNIPAGQVCLPRADAPSGLGVAGRYGFALPPCRQLFTNDECGVAGSVGVFITCPAPRGAQPGDCWREREVGCWHPAD